MLARPRLRGKAALTGAAYASMFFLGVGFTIVGAAAGNIGLDAYHIGLLLAAQNTGFLLSVVTAGVLADSVDKPRLLLVGSLVACASFALFYAWQPFLLNLLFMFLVGVAGGVSEGVTDAMLLELHQERQALHVGINHFAVTVGALLITGYLLFLQMSWRLALIQAAAAALLLAVFLLFAGASPSPRRGEQFGARMRQLASRPAIWAALAAAVVFVGIEAGLTGMLTTFLLELRQYDQVGSKVGLILFLAGLAAGRALLGLVVRREHIRRILAVLAAACAAMTVLVCRLRMPPLPTGLALLGLGLSVSALFPLVITMTGQRFPRMTGTAIGVVKLAVPLGGILVPIAVGSAARAFSFETALLAFPALAVAGLAIVLLLPEERLPERSVAVSTSLSHDDG